MPDAITSKEDDTRTSCCFVEQFPELDGTSAQNIFRVIFAPIFDLLVFETNRYATQKNYLLFPVSFSEIQKLVGLIMLSAYKSRRYFRDYCSESKTLECRAFMETMSRSRFQQMKSYTHMYSNEALRTQKRQIYDHNTSTVGGKMSLFTGLSCQKMRHVPKKCKILCQKCEKKTLHLSMCFLLFHLGYFF